MQLEQLFPQTKDLPLEVVEGLLTALLTIRDPGTPRRASPLSVNASGGSCPPPTTFDRSRSGSSVGSGAGGGGGGFNAGGFGGGDAAVAAASFEAHAVLALELSSRVVLANRHRVARLWPSMHGYLARYVIDYDVL